MKKKETKNIQGIELYTTFSFAYIENATNVVMALCRSGYFVNMVNDGTGYRVDIYKRV
jgi:hypothetical protein